MSQCSGTIVGNYGAVYSCRNSGTLEHEGKMYCTQHHPPTREAAEKARNAKWDEKWAKQRAQADASRRELRLGELALEWMRRERPEVVKEWEDEAKM
jgi:hypothetical protein